jgi:hypothetical protein
MIQKITQSFLKDMIEYNAGTLCGNLVIEKWVNDRLFDDEEPGAKELGCYFEFLLTGSLPKNQKVPQPVLLKDNRPDASYRMAAVNAKRLKEYFDEMGLKIVQAGVRLTKGRFEGTLDIIAECTKQIEFDTGIIWNVGDRIAIDTKYSGLIGETSSGYNKLGWKWSNIQKEYHGIQAKQYHFVSNLPIYFLITQSNNKEGTTSDVKLFHTPVSEFMIEQHVIEGNRLFDQFNFRYNSVGFEVRPSLSKCLKCPIKESCEQKHTFPHPEVIDLNIE